MQRMYRKYDDQYSEKVESEVESRQKVTKDLFCKYRKGIMRSYADILTTVHHLKRSMIYQEVTEEIQTLMNEKHYRFVQALKRALLRNSSLFNELTANKKMMIGVLMRNLIRIPRKKPLKRIGNPISMHRMKAPQKITRLFTNSQLLHRFDLTSKFLMNKIDICKDD